MISEMLRFRLVLVQLLTEVYRAHAHIHSQDVTELGEALGASGIDPQQYGVGKAKPVASFMPRWFRANQFSTTTCRGFWCGSSVRSRFISISIGRGISLRLSRFSMTADVE